MARRGGSGAWFVAAAIVGACGGGGGGGTGATEALTTVDTPTTGTSTTGAPTTGGGATGTTGTTGAGATGTTGAAGSSSGGETGGATTCTDNCRYVRAGAAGGGADWDDALPELPAELERGRVYFVAAGQYPGYTFDDPEAGEATITVLRATAEDHGTEVGWDPGYAAGEATMGPLVFATGRHVVDGRGASRAVGVFQGTVVEIGAPAVELRGFDVDGNFQARGGVQTDGACTGMSVSADDVVVAGNRIHDAADDGVSISGLARLTFAGNTVHALHGCGTDGGCGPCYNGHSDGLELYDVADSEITGNLIYDVASTSAVFFGNWADELGMGPAEYCEGVRLTNNILYGPETGFVAYIEDARGVQVVNNVIWGLHQGAYGGLSIGTHVEDLDLYNNAILSINYTHIGGMYDPAEHRGDYNLFAYSLGQWQDGPHDVVAVDPGFVGIPGGEGPAVTDPAPGDFAPKDGGPLVDAGWAGDGAIMVPPADFFGAPRDGTPNLGAIE